MRYKCSIYNPETEITDRWEINLYIISRSGPFTEFVTDGRGTRIHAVAGPQANGNLVSLPEYGVCSELADYSDFFWNFERLSRRIGKVDAATLATALKYLKVQN